MNNFLKLAFRRLFRKGEHTTARIISLTLGLAFGILLLSEVLYYYSFDSFYPDANRVYIVQENFKSDKSTDKIDTYPATSGAIAPGMKAEVPGIEAATRMTDIGNSVFYTDDKKSYKGDFVLADNNLFDVLPRPMISGDAKKILSTPMACMVSSKIADEMGGDVIGKVIEPKEYPGRKLTIEGVFEALPENTNNNYDIAVSLVSIANFIGDGRNNWIGNDRYYSAVKLQPGIKPESLAPAIRQMQIKHQDIEKLEQQQGGMVLKYTLAPIKKLYLSNVKKMIIILTTIAFAVLFVSLMNYTLLTLSALTKRAKSAAIQKTCGADARNLQLLIFSETFVLFIISIVSALLVILLLKPYAEMQVGHKLASMLNPTVIWPLIGLMVLLVILTSYLPGRFFSRIPVATAFRTYRQKKNKWELVLLSLQFIGASFILTMMVVVSLQYNKALTADYGYTADGVYYASSSGLEPEKTSTIINELQAIPGVEKVGLGSELPIDGMSGNNVLSPDKQKELFNIADLYYIDENYLSILGIQVQDGENFSSQNATPGDALISEKGAEKLKTFNGWKNAIGQQVTITEHGQTTIRGVYPDFIINTVTNPDSRPSAFFYLPDKKFEEIMKKYPSYSFYFMIKVDKNADNGMLAKIENTINPFLPHHDAVVKSLEVEQRHTYQDEKGFRNAMMAGNIVILIITVIGLLGYTSNEAERRRKELAIRKINGATFSDILKIFITDLELITVPAVLVGLVIAWIIAGKWMQNFAVKVPLNWLLFLGCGLVIILIVAFVSTINYARTANQNPVESLRYE